MNIYYSDDVKGKKKCNPIYDQKKNYPTGRLPVAGVDSHVTISRVPVHQFWLAEDFDGYMTFKLDMSFHFERQEDLSAVTSSLGYPESQGYESDLKFSVKTS